MKVRIEDHAIENYIERVMGIPLEQSDQYLRFASEVEIRKAVERPEEVYHGEEDMCQIHIRNEVAIPVGVERDVEGKLYPYTADDDEFVVPTAYKAETFWRKIDDGQREAPA